jgi:hypothetical protein
MVYVLLIGKRYFRIPRYRSVKVAGNYLGPSLLSQCRVGKSRENLKRKMRVN